MREDASEAMREDASEAMREDASEAMREDASEAMRPNFAQQNLKQRGCPQAQRRGLNPSPGPVYLGSRGLAPGRNETLRSKVE